MSVDVKGWRFLLWISRKSQMWEKNWTREFEERDGQRKPEEFHLPTIG